MSTVAYQQMSLINGMEFGMELQYNVSITAFTAN